MSPNRLVIISVVVMLMPFCSDAQKFERESPIKLEDMPSAITEYLDQRYPKRERERFYEEYSYQGEDAREMRLYYEAKFDANGHWYSIKFDSTGRLYDTERLVTKRRLPAKSLEGIQKDLSLYFRRYKIDKIQEVLDPQEQVTGYEIVVRARHDQVVGYFELQYNTDAQRTSVLYIRESLNPFFFF